ncbi:hypothetical protein ACTPC6_01155 [Clostridioides difficile]
MKNKYKKIIILFLILISCFICLNIYLDSQKESININKSFDSTIAIKDNKIYEKLNVDIDGKLSETHFIYRYLRYSKQLKGTVVLNGEKYNISASSSLKDNTLEGILTKESNALISDFSVVISEDFKQICIYKGDYIIASPANSLYEAKSIYKDIADIPND